MHSQSQHFSFSQQNTLDAPTATQRITTVIHYHTYRHENSTFDIKLNTNHHRTPDFDNLCATKVITERPELAQPQAHSRLRPSRTLDAARRTGLPHTFRALGRKTAKDTRNGHPILYKKNKNRQAKYTSRTPIILALLTVQCMSCSYLALLRTTGLHKGTTKLRHTPEFLPRTNRSGYPRPRHEILTTRR